MLYKRTFPRFSGELPSNDSDSDNIVFSIFYGTSLLPYREAKQGRLIPGKEIIGTARGQVMVIIGDYRQLGGREGGIIIHGDLAATTGETRVCSFCPVLW